MNFKMWLEGDEDENYSRWKDIVIGHLNLNQENGLSIPLDSFNPEHLKAKLQSLAEFGKLQPGIQKSVLDMISMEQSGTVGDLIRKIAGEPRMAV